MPYRGNIISLFLYLNEEKSFVILASNRRSETGRMRKKGKLKLRTTEDEEELTTREKEEYRVE